MLNYTVNSQILWFTNEWEIQKQMQKKMMILKGVGDDINKNLFPNYFFFVYCFSLHKLYLYFVHWFVLTLLR